MLFIKIHRVVLGGSMYGIEYLYPTCTKRGAMKKAYREYKKHCNGSFKYFCNRYIMKVEIVTKGIIS